MKRKVGCNSAIFKETKYRDPMSFRGRSSIMRSVKGGGGGPEGAQKGACDT